LKGKITDDQLLKACSSLSQQTSAHYCIACKDIWSGHWPEALDQLQWIIKSGDKRMDEYYLAIAEQQRVQQKNR